MKYKIGAVVKVKEGIMVPDIPFSIEGWHGRIREPDEDVPEMIIVEMDSLSLKAFPEEYIILAMNECGEDDFYKMYLENDDVELAEARDTLEETEAVIDNLVKQYRWKSLGNKDAIEEAIENVLTLSETDDDFYWEGYIEENVTFPVKMKVVEGFHNRNETFKMTGLDDTDDHYGIIVKGKDGRNRVNLPLCDLEVVDKVGQNYIILKAYAIWFVNH